MKLINKCKEKIGFTLVEMVVVMTVLVILLSFITPIFVQTMRIETGIADIAQTEVIATEVVAELLDDLRSAKAIDASNPTELIITTSDYTATYSVDPVDGVLLRKYDTETVERVLADGFYMGNTMALTWAEAGSPTTKDYTLTLNVFMYESDGDEVYSEQYTLRPTFINANG